MKRKSLISLMLLAAVSMAACGKTEKETDTGAESSDGEVKEFTAFFAVPGTEINDDNEIQQKLLRLQVLNVKRHGLQDRLLRKL